MLHISWTDITITTAEVKKGSVTICRNKNQNTEKKSTDNIDDTISFITDISLSQMSGWNVTGVEIISLFKQLQRKEQIKG